MALKKSEKRLLIILGIAVAVFLVDRFVLSKSDKKSPPQPVNQTSTVTGLASAKVKTAVVSTRNIEGKKVFDNWGRDPFNEKVYTGKCGGKFARSGSTPKLKGLFWKEGHAYVMVDDEILKVGEEKEGLKIERVEGKAVFCRQGNRSFTLHWSESL